MKKLLLFRNVVLAFLLLLIPLTMTAQQQTKILMDSTHWEKISCGNWITSPDSLSVSGTDYRIAGVVETKGFFDFSHSKIYIKWKVKSDDKFMAVSLFAGGVALGHFVTTDHVYAGSKLINEGEWYYTQAQFHPADSSFTAIRSTGNFYDNGGTLYDSLRQKLSSKQWEFGILNGKIKAMIHDNYGGVNCSLTLDTVILVNAVERLCPDILSTQSFTFENGKIPAEIQTDSSSWFIADTGYESKHSIYLDQTPGHSSWFEMNVKGAAKISFDARFISGYSWNAVMSASFAIDTLNQVIFDRSNMGCWHHFEWLLPDAGSHNLRWYSSYSGSYPQDNSQLWIDNIRVDYTETTGIQSHNKNNISLLQCFPNPFVGNITIQYGLTKPSFVRVEIFNNVGQRIKILDSGNYNAGKYSIHWHAGSLSSGIYSCKITTNNGFVIKKLVLER